jgi:hypothetical protein
MSNGGMRDRASLVSSLSFLIAAMSLGSSFYQGYLNTKNLEIVQRDVSRREYIRSCKEIVETYFDVRPDERGLREAVESRTVIG